MQAGESLVPRETRRAQAISWNQAARATSWNQCPARVEQVPARVLRWAAAMVATKTPPAGGLPSLAVLESGQGRTGRTGLTAACADRGSEGKVSVSRQPEEPLGR